MGTVARLARRGVPLLAAVAALLAIAPAARAQAPFQRHQLTTDYLAEGADVGDFDRDGVLDVTSGSLWWEGPDFTTSHAIYAGAPASIFGYSPHFMSFVRDMDGDGWDDVVAVGFPGQALRWFENPRGAGGPWSEHVMHAGVGTESPAFAQVVAGGAPEFVCSVGAELGYLTADPGDATAPWTFHRVIAAGFDLTFLHGLGVGDVDGDGRADILTGFGWLEQPDSLVGDPTWALRPWNFGAIAGAQMYAYDVDGDGDADLVSGIAAHGYGLSWFESSGGALPVFVEHEILPKVAAPPATGQFSQLHALELADVDGDGLLDLVTGKTWLAHNGTDPGWNDPVVLYWFRLERSMQGATFVQHLVDDDSGVGRRVVVRDVDGDGLADVVVGNKKGVLVLERRSLWADVDSIDLTTGGTQVLSLDAGVARAGGVYVIGGSASGTQPGIAIDGFLVPLVPDSYTLYLLGALNSTTFSGFLGALDAQGRATANLVVPPGLALLPGLQLHHAFAVWDGFGVLQFVSNELGVVLN